MNPDVISEGDDRQRALTAFGAFRARLDGDKDAEELYRINFSEGYLAYGIWGVTFGVFFSMGDEAAAVELKRLTEETFPMHEYPIENSMLRVAHLLLQGGTLPWEPEPQPMDPATWDGYLTAGLAMMRAGANHREVPLEALLTLMQDALTQDVA